MTNTIIKEDIDLIFRAGIAWDQFANKTILISGASGFIASYMVETLLYLNEKLTRQNTKVIALVRNMEKAKVRFIEYTDRSDLILLVQDVSDDIAIDEQIDFIIHAASQASPKYYSVDPVGTLRANIFGTTNLLTLASRFNAKSVLFFSSSEVYGEVSDQLESIGEDDFGYVSPTQVRSCYAESKRMGENLCISWAHQYGLDVKIVRPFHTYGPKMELNDGRVFADFAADLVNNRDIVMKSDGTSRRAYCYLADAVIAYFLVLLNGKSGEAYNIGDPGNECSVLELANRLVNIFPEKNLTVITKENNNLNYLASKVNRVTPNIAKIKALGWKPRFTIEEGFKRTVNSYAF